MNPARRQQLVERIIEGQILAVVRAPAIPDAVALSTALAAGGIPLIELTFTTTFDQLSFVFVVANTLKAEKDSLEYSTR